MWLKYRCLHVLVPQGRKNGEEQGGGLCRTRLPPLPYCKTLSSASQHDSRLSRELLPVTPCPSHTLLSPVLPLEQDGAPQPAGGLSTGGERPGPLAGSSSRGIVLGGEAAAARLGHKAVPAEHELRLWAQLAASPPAPPGGIRCQQDPVCVSEGCLAFREAVTRRPGAGFHKPS